ncbi:Uma2 family endonuclease [Desulfosporosinus lacus]|uniref:Endonuclease, Uma2 family (Restriction endonuclease fold) n=1 Tax=Desulfosporosinus lacus DSM 15449 TaxID=1121420 RepID=A0A1M5RVT6_9FIRM|nr:Uma2 family endonuclease [Desulfosporosinus lacus]SHH30415.1 Endonuclease, Uma2 family (restriction endonuclease fold) [Desulfosporosinus lacus DSM 15449]
MSLPAQKDNKRYSYAEYLKWSDDKRWELLDGIAFNIAAPSRRHQEVSGELFYQIRSCLADKSCKIYSAPFDVRFSEPKQKDEQIVNVVQPDLTIVCDKSKLDDKGCLGAPNLIIEIISPTSISLDYVKKLALYEKYHVKEYWIIHPIDNTVMVFTLGEDYQYGRPSIFMEDCQLKSGVITDLTIDLKQVFGILG